MRKHITFEGHHTSPDVRFRSYMILHVRSVVCLPLSLLTSTYPIGIDRSHTPHNQWPEEYDEFLDDTTEFPGYFPDPDKVNSVVKHRNSEKETVEQYDEANFVHLESVDVDCAKMGLGVVERRQEAMIPAGIYMASSRIDRACHTVLARMPKLAGRYSGLSFTISAFISRRVLALHDIMIISTPFELHAFRHTLITHMLSVLRCWDSNVAAASYVRSLRYLKTDSLIHGPRPSPPTIREWTILFGAAKLNM